MKKIIIYMHYFDKYLAYIFNIFFNFFKQYFKDTCSESLLFKFPNRLGNCACITCMFVIKKMSVLRKLDWISQPA
jgi:hypothetical protein